MPIKDKIIEIAHNNLIDEIKFIDTDSLTEKHVGDPSFFAGRQAREIMPEARTLILVSVYIGNFESPSSDEYGRISRLVLSGFYANVNTPVIPIAEYLRSEGFKAIMVDGSSDNESISLKGSAVKAGMGWIGKNSLVISEQYGSLQAFGAILTDIDLAEKYPLNTNLCGNCTRCMDVCPVKALKTPRRLTRTECLSYVFGGGEYSGAISLDSVDSKSYFFECDICQNACPWNQPHFKKPLNTPYGRMFNREKTEQILDKKHLMEMDEQTYQEELVPLMVGFAIPYQTFRRNLLIMGAAPEIGRVKI